MEPLLAAAEIQAQETRLIGLGLSESVLMEHAALAVVRRLERRFGSLLPSTRGQILAGNGKNGGDAFAVARLLLALGVSQFDVKHVASERDAPLCAAQRELFEKLKPTNRIEESTESLDWVVDGLFGTGLTRPIQGIQAEWVAAANEAKAWKVAIDVPSGLSADTGRRVGEVCFRASETVTFGFYKGGLVTGEAKDFVGRLHLEPIQIPRGWVTPEHSRWLYTRNDARLPTRRAAGHKGNFGHVLLVGGAAGMEGAVAIAAQGAFRMGAGLVSVAQAGPRSSSLPVEVMSTPWAELSNFEKFSSIGIGPGLGKSAEARAVLDQVVGCEARLVLDADALNLISEVPDLVKRVQTRSGITVLTPHPKEAARLLGCGVEAIENNRWESCLRLSQQLKAWVVLKGSGSIVSSPHGQSVAVTSGDTGLAKGGSGDLLTGVLTTLIGQTDAPSAIPLSVWIHGRASELVTERNGQARSTVASDVAGALVGVIRELEEGLL